MGMYTHLKLDFEISPDFADEVDRYIQKTPRMQSTSYYFRDKGINELERDYSVHADGQPPLCVLHTDISLKNYEDEIKEFLRFLEGKGFSPNEGFVGFFRYEESDDPTLIYYRGGMFQLKEVV